MESQRKKMSRNQIEKPALMADPNIDLLKEDMKVYLIKITKKATEEVSDKSLK